MTDNIEALVFGSAEQVTKCAKVLPVPCKPMDTMKNFEVYLLHRPHLIFLLLLFFNPSNPILHPVLQELEKRKIPIYCALNCGDDPTDNSANIPFISQLLLPYKVTSTVAHFLEKEFIKQCNLDNSGLSLDLYHQGTKIRNHFDLNNKIDVSHILLIPLNATLKDVHEVQQRLKCLCYELYGNEYEYIIHTLSDRITQDEKDPDEESFTAYLQKRYKGDICRTIMDSGFIRMYVVGNEPRIFNKWCEELVAAEADINEEHTLKYVDRCTFITKERLENRFAHDLVPLFGRNWKIRKAIAKPLDDVCNDLDFQDILPRIHGCLKNREISINCESNEEPSVNPDHVRLSSQIHPNEQARNGPVETQVEGNLKNTILSNR